MVPVDCLPEGLARGICLIRVGCWGPEKCLLTQWVECTDLVSWLLEPTSATPMVEVPDGTDAECHTLGTQSFIFPCPRW